MPNIHKTNGLIPKAFSAKYSLENEDWIHMSDTTPSIQLLFYTYEASYLSLFTEPGQ